MKKNYATLVMAGLFLMNLPAQAQEANYDESNVGTYTLPDALTSLNGQQVIKKKTASFKDYTIIPESIGGDGQPHELAFVLSYTDLESPIVQLNGTVTIDQALSLNVLAYRDENSPFDRTAENPFVGDWNLEISFGTAKFPLFLQFDESTVSAVNDDIPYVTSETETRGFMYPASADTTNWQGKNVKISGILKKKKGVNFGCLSRGVYYTPELTKTFIRDSVNTAVVNSVEDGKEGMATYIKNNVDDLFRAYVKFEYTSYAKGDQDNEIARDVPGFATSLNTTMQSSISNMFSITGSTYVETNREYIDILESYKIAGIRSFTTSPDLVLKTTM